MEKYILVLLISIIYTQFTIKSDDFQNGGMLDRKFTPFGKDIIPSLRWSNPPEGTKSYALICEDPELPSGVFTHWAIKNIPGSVSKIDRGGKIGEEIRNSWGLKRYRGPRPPSDTHIYYFNLYALSIESLNARNIKELRQQIKRNKIGKTYIMGKFKKE